MPALTSSLLNPPAPRGASWPGARANGRYAPPNQGNRPSEPARRSYRRAPAHPSAPWQRRARAASRRWALTKYCPPKRVVIAESAGPGGNFGPPERSP